MKVRVQRCGVFFAALLYAGSASAQISYGVNVLLNPGVDDTALIADCGAPPVPHWALSGGAAVFPWDASGGWPTHLDPGPSDRGANLFIGGCSSPGSTAQQEVDISSIASDVDADTVDVSASAYLGGYDGQSDNTLMRVECLDENLQVLSTLSIGPVSAADRGSVTGLLERSGVGHIAPGTRVVLVTLVFTRFQGSNNDGYADSISLILSGGGPMCFADFNQDGGIDGADVSAFFAAWEAGDIAADVNVDGGVDGADVDAFFREWEAGGC